MAGVVVPRALARGALPQDDGDDVEMADATSKLARVGASCEGRFKRFVVSEDNKSFTRQYSHVYNERLKALRPEICKQVGKNINVIPKTVEMEAGKSHGLVIGTVYKEQRLKPSVLNEFADEFDGRALTDELDNFCADDDELFLEDESGRIPLTNIDPKEKSGFVTGVIIGAKGKLLENGEFWVEELIPAGLPPQPHPLLAVQKAAAAKTQQGARKDQFLLLVSGLRVGSEKSDPIKMEMLVEHVTGQLGGSADHTLEAEIARVIIAGGSIADLSDSSSQNYINNKKKNSTNKLAVPVRELDLSLLQMSAAVPVDIMPGESDPCNITMPQQPLHQCLFQQSGRFETFNRVTNPYECAIGGDVGSADKLVVLGSSGQPVSDMLKYTLNTQPTDSLERMLRWRHMAPTAPDTLACYPFADKEPFVIEQMPHLFFAGNQAAFGTKLLRADPSNESGAACRLVSIPSFSETGLVVLVNLSSPTLECSTIGFSAQ